MKIDGVDINFDLSKHFIPILRVVLVISIFCLIFGFVISTEVSVECNQITLTAHKAGETIGNLLFNVFLVLVGFIMILLGVSVFKEGTKELNDLRKEKCKNSKNE